MRKKKLIIAGTYIQAERFAKKQNWKCFEYTVVWSPAQLEGLVRPTVYLVGTYKDQPMLRQLTDIVRRNNGQFIHEAKL